MAALPASPVPTISPAEMQILISRSGLVLNPGQMADLVLAWRQIVGLIATIPQGRKLADDAAFSFRLPPPAAAAKPHHGAVARVAAKPAGKPVVRTKAKTVSGTKPKAKQKATARALDRTSRGQ